MATQHEAESEVAAILKLSSKKDKDAAFATLRKKGDFEANIESAKVSTGYATVVRESQELNVINYSPCIHCFGMFSTKTLTRHMHTCSVKDKSGKEPGNVKSSKCSFKDTYQRNQSLLSLENKYFLE